VLETNATTTTGDTNDNKDGEESDESAGSNVIHLLTDAEAQFRVPSVFDPDETS